MTITSTSFKGCPDAKTSSGYRSAKHREKLKHKNGKKTETIYYDPNDPKYLKGSSTYIGPQKK